MTLKVIAYARNGHTDKFGIPRQSREDSPILTRIVFEPEYRSPEALRGIEGYSHLWLIWGFSRSHPLDTGQNEVLTESPQALRSPQKLKIFGGPNSLDWSPTVRPPRLGGNKRMGVFATRSPFRPNPIGLSSVKLIEVRRTDVRCTKDGEKGKSTKGGGLELIVSGADLLDGTPIYDIKPYLSFSDSHEDAKNGFAEETKDYKLSVEWGEVSTISAERPTDHPLITHLSPTQTSEKERILSEIEYILSQDPRPAYQDDPERVYKMDYAGLTVTFCVDGQKVIVKRVDS